ncbi:MULTISPECIES: NAD-dependent epimerase/dehydratase family protein [Rhizobium]|uniref:2'-hydroxyisoflavone reductase n=1 Tax=Rhizobium binae TaxID=1138190 RepID=A0ABV2MKY8_9HYPH|nr:MULTISPECIES: NAD-dependent epimerase/dehydratase family protein [Rhizobium]NKL49595.1 NAD-dependent epimerase/dehydratase family protein [Rhizobium leguminosarum bv. viciae]MBX4937063.1 NAD-dependent epimerase/dehydratase family protein [Rhizobium binae]MBX4943713.1 NAD-dependent epimerase/dehydratase family protein [Rhizobium binae]MBX4979157.1 NAD-dependent epimerase/dehydratase family protein [Rhizobium binae]MBX4995894.1 NAD-dependent epimerase/dehydratase family protein [Rhizobium bin
MTASDLESSCPLITPASRSNGPRRPLHILILGGTDFLGPHQVRYAAERGHIVTVFNRGRQHAALPTSVRHLRGEREGQLDSLKSGSWDAVIDNSATSPAWVRLSAELLKDRAELYMYVSSTGVYFPYLTSRIDESIKPTLVEDAGKACSSFGVRKALSEIEAEKAFPQKTCIVRPHYIVGPGDSTYRFPYWPLRFERGGEILAPGRMMDPVQYVDVRDLTEWMIRMVEEAATGIYNVAGPRTPMTMVEFLAGVQAAVSGSNPVHLTWIDDYDFLKSHGIDEAVPWMPLSGDNLGFASINFDKALERGLTHRSLADTIRDTLSWWHSDAVRPERKANPRLKLTPAKEAEVLAAWKRRRAAIFNA